MERRVRYVAILFIILVLVLVTIGSYVYLSSTKNNEIRLHVLCINMSDKVSKVVLRISIYNDEIIYTAATNVSKGTIEIYNKPVLDRTGYVVNTTIDNSWMGEVLIFPSGTNQVEIIINENSKPQISVASA